jgi:hypothetical protein
LAKGLRIFEEQGVVPDVWIAPGHSFDHATLDVLVESGLTSVSDGFMAYPCRDDAGVFWIPQQLWRFRPMPFGVWTVCVHHNRWRSRDVARLHADLRRYAGRVIGLREVRKEHGARRLGWTDRAFSQVYRTAFQTFQIKHRRRLIDSKPSPRPGEP